MSRTQVFKTNNLKILRVYQAKGKVCTCKSGASCPTPGKHPAPWEGEKNLGVHNARELYEEELFAGYNIGVACGDGLLVVDVDPRNNGHLTWHEIVAGNEIPETLEVATGGGGSHIYFRIPEGFPCRNLSFEGVDFQYGGKYVIAPPSIHPSGNEYQWVDCDPDETEIATIPEWLKDWITAKTNILQKSMAPKGTTEMIEPSDWEWPLIHEILSKLSPDIGYSNWLGVGMGLHATGHPHAFDYWHAWSKRDKEKYRPGECEIKWKSFGIGRRTMDESHTYKWIFAMADLFGVQYGVELDNSLKKLIWEKDLSAVKEFNFREIVDSSGPILQELTHDCLSTSHRQIESFAFGSALTVLSTIVQCVYTAPLRGSLNLYQWFAAPAGVGKDSYYKWIKSTVGAVNPSLVCGDVGSVQGLRVALSAYNSRLLIQDEFHDQYLQMSGSRNEFLKALARDYKELWNIPESTLPIVVKNSVTPGSEWPSLSLVAFGTIAGLEQCMDATFLSSGLGSRFLFWRHEGEEYTKREVARLTKESGHEKLIETLKLLHHRGRPTTAETLSQWDEISRIQDELNDKKKKRTTIVGQAKVLPRVTIAAGNDWLESCLNKDDYKAWQMRNDEAVSAMYYRVGQIAIRLGCLRAISHGREELFEEDYQWGRSIILGNIHSITRDLSTKQSVSRMDDETIKRCEAVIAVMRKTEENSYLQKRDILKRLKMDARNLEHVLTQLILLEKIKCIDRSGRRIYPEKLEYGYQFSLIKLEP